MNPKIVPPEHVPFVQAALRKRLNWPNRRAIREVIEELKRNGVADVTLSGSSDTSVAALPFHLNIQARIPDGASIERLMHCFSASVKFGGSHGNRRGRVCVVKMDGSHGGWHLHPFDPELGTHAPATSDRVLWMPDLALGSVDDAVVFVVNNFCGGGLNYEQTPGISWLSSIPAQRTTLSLLVPGA